MKLFLCGSLVAVGSLLGGCYGLYGYDEGERYVERKDTITMSAGDAKEVNARTHMETPWPAYVGDRRITANGERMANAVKKYRLGSAGEAPPPAPAAAPNANGQQQPSAAK